MSFKIISLHSIQATFKNRVILIFLNYSYQTFQEETFYYWIPKAACSALQKYIFFITGRGRGKVNKGWKQTNKYNVNSFIESYLYFGKPLYLLWSLSFLFRETMMMIIAVFTEKILIEEYLSRNYATVKNIRWMNISYGHKIRIKAIKCTLKVSRCKSHSYKSGVPRIKAVPLSARGIVTYILTSCIDGINDV